MLESLGVGGEDPGFIIVHGSEAHNVFAAAAGDHLIETYEGTTNDEENVGGIYLDVFLLGMFAAALRGDVADGAFEDF